MYYISTIPLRQAFRRQNPSSKVFDILTMLNPKLDRHTIVAIHLFLENTHSLILFIKSRVYFFLISLPSLPQNSTPLGTLCLKKFLKFLTHMKRVLGTKKKHTNRSRNSLLTKTKGASLPPNFLSHYYQTLLVSKGIYSTW